MAGTIIPELSTLGNRIAIIGPSNSGKSTLAFNLSVKLSVPVLHLDQLVHYPHTNWQRRPNEDWLPIHDEFIEQDGWIVEGNYSICMPQRFARTTAVIWLHPQGYGFIYRYLKRSWGFGKRFGRLEGGKKDFNLGLIRWTLNAYPTNTLKYERLLSDHTNALVLKIPSIRQLNACYKQWGIRR